MGGVGGKLLLSLEGPLQPAKHLVEGVRQPGELMVPRGNRHPGGEVGRLVDGRGGGGDLLQGPEGPVDDPIPPQSGQEDETLGTLLDRYAARSDYVTLETIDPDVSPNFLQEYVSGTVYNNSLIVESGDRNTYVSYEDIYESSYSSDYSSYDVSFAGESSLTSAIDYVLSDTLPKLYTLTGHGEDDLSTSFQSAVEQQNIEAPAAESTTR